LLRFFTTLSGKDTACWSIHDGQDLWNSLINIVNINISWHGTYELFINCKRVTTAIDIKFLFYSLLPVLIKY
jgi:hypothetical protein